MKRSGLEEAAAVNAVAAAHRGLAARRRRRRKKTRASSTPRRDRGLVRAPRRERARDDAVGAVGGRHARSKAGRRRRRRKNKNKNVRPGDGVRVFENRATMLAYEYSVSSRESHGVCPVLADPGLVDTAINREWPSALRLFYVFAARRLGVLVSRRTPPRSRAARASTVFSRGRRDPQSPTSREMRLPLRRGGRASRAVAGRRGRARARGVRARARAVGAALAASDGRAAESSNRIVFKYSRGSSIRRRRVHGSLATYERRSSFETWRRGSASGARALGPRAPGRAGSRRSRPTCTRGGVASRRRRRVRAPTKTRHSPTTRPRRPSSVARRRPPRSASRRRRRRRLAGCPARAPAGAASGPPSGSTWSRRTRPPGRPAPGRAPRRSSRRAPRHPAPTCASHPRRRPSRTPRGSETIAFVRGVPFVRAFARPKKKTASRDAERLVTRRSSSSRCSSSKRPSSSASSGVVVVVRVFVARARRELGARRPQHRVGAARPPARPHTAPAGCLPSRTARRATARRGVPRAVRKRSHYGVAFFFFLCPGARRAPSLSSPSPSARGHTRRFPFPAAGKGKVRRARAVRVRVGVRVAQRAREPSGNARRWRATKRKRLRTRRRPRRRAPSSSSLPPPSEEARVVVVGSRRAHPHARGHVPVQVVPQAERAAPVAPPAEEAPSAARARSVARRRHGDDAAPRRRSRRRLREALDASHRGVEPGGASAVVLERRDPASACLERARTADTADTAGEKFRRVGARRRVAVAENGDAARGDPPAPSRSRRIRRARSRDFGEEERRSNDPAKCCTSAEAPACCPARADPRRRSPSSTATRPRRRRARASGPPRRRRFEGEKRRALSTPTPAAGDANSGGRLAGFPEPLIAFVSIPATFRNARRPPR